MGDAPNAVPVAVRGFTWSAAAGWSTFVVILGAIGMAIRNAGPFATKIAELVMNRGDKIRAENREEEMSDKQQIVALSERMNRMSGAFAFLANAVTASISGLASDDTKFREETANRARELVAMAVSTLGNDDPFAKSLDRLASIPPVDRSAKS